MITYVDYNARTLFSNSKLINFLEILLFLFSLEIRNLDILSNSLEMNNTSVER